MTTQAPLPSRRSTLNESGLPDASQVIRIVVALVAVATTFVGDGGGGSVTVTVADPLVVPAQLYAFLTEVSVYVVVVAGDTFRVLGDALAVVVAPSDQVRVHGAVPVSVTVSVALPPCG